MSIYEMSCAGTRHIDTKTENQDAVFHGSNSRYSVISLADGVSECADAKTGAEISSKAITELFADKGGHFLECGREQIAKFAISHLLYALTRCANENGKDVKEYSSTVSSVLYDRKKKRLLCFNLGDAMILGMGMGKCRILAMPSDSTYGCCTTTTKNASVATTAAVTDAVALDSIIICSDGAWRNMFEKNRLKTDVAEMLKDGAFGELKKFLKKQDSFDDYSFIAIDTRCKKSPAVKSQVKKRG